MPNSAPSITMALSWFICSFSYCHWCFNVTQGMRASAKLSPSFSLDSQPSSVTPRKTKLLNLHLTS